MLHLESLSTHRSADRHFNPMHPLGMPGAIRAFEPRSAEAASLPVAFLAAVLDELDYGILLLADRSGRVETVNHAARLALAEDHPLRLSEGQLTARLPCDMTAFRNAVTAAFGQGLRRLLTVGDAQCRHSVSIVPLKLAEDRPGVLVILGKRAACEELSISGFGVSHGLTSAETRILTELSGGASPKQIADRLDVSITTVRSHISSLRAKTGAVHIGALLTRVALLPPLRGVLRRGDASRHPQGIR